jgi:hypothetical protein
MKRCAMRSSVPRSSKGMEVVVKRNGSSDCDPHYCQAGQESNSARRRGMSIPDLSDAVRRQDHFTVGTDGVHRVIDDRRTGQPKSNFPSRARRDAGNSIESDGVVGEIRLSSGHAARDGGARTNSSASVPTGRRRVWNMGTSVCDWEPHNRFAH